MSSPFPIRLASLNSLPEPEAIDFFLHCCGSRRWAMQMTAQRPFSSVGSAQAAADGIWQTLTPKDWIEAFTRHPRIGDVRASTPTVAAQEQSGMALATSAQRAAFVTINREYERRFGHVFLICATGKAAATMLDQARLRLLNDPTTELNNATREQTLITQLRLEKLLLP